MKILSFALCVSPVLLLIWLGDGAPTLRNTRAKAGLNPADTGVEERQKVYPFPRKLAEQEFSNEKELSTEYGNSKKEREEEGNWNIYVDRSRKQTIGEDVESGDKPIYPSAFRAKSLKQNILKRIFPFFFPPDPSEALPFESPEPVNNVIILETDMTASGLLISSPGPVAPSSEPIISESPEPSESPAFDEKLNPSASPEQEEYDDENKLNLLTSPNATIKKGMLSLFPLYLKGKMKSRPWKSVYLVFIQRLLKRDEHPRHTA